jgi:hypothetical protein
VQGCSGYTMDSENRGSLAADSSITSAVANRIMSGTTRVAACLTAVAMGLLRFHAYKSRVIDCNFSRASFTATQSLPLPVLFPCSPGYAAFRAVKPMAYRKTTVMSEATPPF